MPAKTEKQKKFMGVARGVQKGSTKGSPEAKKAASSMTAKQVKDYATKKK